MADRMIHGQVVSGPDDPTCHQCQTRMVFLGRYPYEPIPEEVEAMSDGQKADYMAGPQVDGTFSGWGWAWEFICPRCRAILTII